MDTLLDNVTFRPNFLKLNISLTCALQILEMYFHVWLGILMQFLFLKGLLFATVKNSTGKHGVMMRMSSLQPVNYTRPNITVNASEIEGRSSSSSSTWINEARCGVRNTKSSDHSPRIVGGTNAVRGDWPWMAMILRYYKNYNNQASNNKFSFVCGGTLIKKQWVLTAAHCFFNNPISYTHVVLGAHRKDMEDDSAKRFAIAKYICHHLFIGPTNAYVDDVCLIKLAGETQYTDYIRPVCLPTGQQNIMTGETCKIAGWGDTQGTGDNSILQNANVLVLKKVFCDSWYRETGVILPQDHFCAGYEAGGVDSCQGDSGGPLTCIRQKVTTMFGITSFGIGCALKHRPGVYADVPKYIGWIQEQIEKNSGKESCFSSSDIFSCGSTITRSGTKLRSPIVDSQTWIYPSNTDCSWKIVAPIGYFIKLVFECFFHVEINPSNTQECYDYMSISSEEADMNSIYCGSLLLNPVTINSNRAKISFNSDSSVESSGFVLKIVFIRDPNYQTPTTTEKNAPQFTVDPRLGFAETKKPCYREPNTTATPFVDFNTTHNITINELATTLVPCEEDETHLITNSEFLTTPEPCDEGMTHLAATNSGMRKAPCKEGESTTSHAEYNIPRTIFWIVHIISLFVFQLF